MSLDSKQKRGSAMLVGMPFRTWLTEPTGTVSVGPRLSLLRLCSAVTPTTGQPYIARVSGVPGVRLGGSSFGRGW